MIFFDLNSKKILKLFGKKKFYYFFKLPSVFIDNFATLKLNDMK